MIGNNSPFRNRYKNQTAARCNTTASTQTANHLPSKKGTKRRNCRWQWDWSVRPNFHVACLLLALWLSFYFLKHINIMTSQTPEVIELDPFCSLLYLRLQHTFCFENTKRSFYFLRRVIYVGCACVNAYSFYVRVVAKMELKNSKEIHCDVYHNVNIPHTHSWFLFC